MRPHLTLDWAWFRGWEDRSHMVQWSIGCWLCNSFLLSLVAFANTELQTFIHVVAIKADKASASGFLLKLLSLFRLMNTIANAYNGQIGIQELIQSKRYDNLNVLELSSLGDVSSRRFRLESSRNIRADLIVEQIHRQTAVIVRGRYYILVLQKSAKRWIRRWVWNIRIWEQIAMICKSSHQSQFIVQRSHPHGVTDCAKKSRQPSNGFTSRSYRDVFGIHFTSIP